MQSFIFTPFFNNLKIGEMKKTDDKKCFGFNYEPRMPPTEVDRYSEDSPIEDPRGLNPDSNILNGRWFKNVSLKPTRIFDWKPLLWRALSLTDRKHTGPRARSADGVARGLLHYRSCPVDGETVLK